MKGPGFVCLTGIVPGCADQAILIAKTAASTCSRLILQIQTGVLHVTGEIVLGEREIVYAHCESERGGTLDNGEWYVLLTSSPLKENHYEILALPQ